MSFDVVDVVDESREFFAPCDSDVIDSLIGEYESIKAKIERISTTMTHPEYTGALQHFLDGNSAERWAPSVESLFALKGAMFSLNSAYWARALALTDVYDTMPQARRDYWNAQLQGKTHIGNSYNTETIPPLPDFEEGTVRNTLGDLLRQRSTFFAERVDGIFRGLSGDHVTNQPQGFGKRMIIGYMLSYGTIRHERSGLIHDLRSVIAKFMGRDEPKHSSSDVLVSELYKCTGQWVTVDGGTMRIRVYKKGTAHMEVHPDMAWRLNQVLSSLHPLAIPAQHRTKPPKAAKEFVMMGRPLPFSVLEMIHQGISRKVAGEDGTRYSLPYKAKEQKAAYQQACDVLEALGAVQDDGVFVFGYEYRDVLRELCLTGCLPDQKAHQYYPTPSKLAQIAVEMAQITPTDSILEPSAGQGGIADHLPKDQTVCVEISALHVKILESKGFACAQGDFIEWAKSAEMFDVIVMNPPFSEGRARTHTNAAISLLKPGGRVVSILPASNKGKDFPGVTCDWSPVYEREFAGTSVSVVIFMGTK